MHEMESMLTETYYELYDFDKILRGIFRSLTAQYLCCPVFNARTVPMVVVPRTDRSHLTEEVEDSETGDIIPLALKMLDDQAPSV